MLGFSILTSTNSLLRAVALSFSTSPPLTAGLTRKILQEKKYRDLEESLKDQTEQSSSEVLLSVARFVLNENIGVARLTLSQTRLEDAGNYTCAPENMGQDTVRLSISKGEH